MQCKMLTEDGQPPPVHNEINCCKANCIGLLTVTSLVVVYLLTDWMFKTFGVWR